MAEHLPPALEKGSDAVVVGGGIIGLCAAREMARRGLKVTLLEAARPGGEASGRNGGGVRQHRRHPAELPLAMASVEMWPEMIAELEDISGWNLEYHQGGNLYLMTDPGREDDALAVYLASVKAGLDLELLDEAATRRLIPGLNPELNLLGSSLCPTDGHANPLLVTRALALAARREGVKIRENEPVQSLETVSGRVAAVVTRRGRYSAGAVVMAAGVWSRELVNSLGLDYPLQVKRSHLLVTEPLPPLFDVFVSADSLPTYYRQALSGGLHIGINSAPVEGGDKRATYGAFKLAGQGATAMVPALAGVRVIRAWAGLTGWTPDAVCIIDRAPGLEGLFMAAGHSGHGFCLGPVTGRLLAQWIVDGQPSLDLSRVAWTRFEGVAL